MRIIIINKNEVNDWVLKIDYEKFRYKTNIFQWTYISISYFYDRGNIVNKNVYTPNEFAPTEKK